MTSAPGSRAELVALATSSPAVRSSLGEPDAPALAAIERASEHIDLDPGVEQELRRTATQLVTAQRQEQRYRELAEEARFGSPHDVLREVAALEQQARDIEARVATWRWLTDPFDRVRAALSHRLGQLGERLSTVLAGVIMGVPLGVMMVLIATTDANPLAVTGGVVTLAGCGFWAHRTDRAERADRRLAEITRQAEATVWRFLEGPAPDETQALERQLEEDETSHQLGVRRRQAETAFHDLALIHLLRPAEHPVRPMEPESPPAEAEIPAPDPPAGVALAPGHEARSDPPGPKRVFVSYARSDLERDPHILNDLKEHCAPFAHRDVFHLWADGEIEVGDDWKRRIESEVSSCDGAVLLVGPGFLASEFIRDEELPTILDRHLANKTRVFPIIVRPCSFTTSPLARFQSFNILDRPVSAMDGHQRDAFLLDVATTIAEAMSD